ncbi:hypothetical protein PPL_07157 [Heterostelium album PN500]|uniref:Uncharacterized protein n=1 Tax=Heterostelium pallidum (strain ATCC 26659 / Pp 5 / PN500) TaxID=670386 RepID=D3BEJ5_HETP5|nr:hypothetical protein PPL_07157 [Heterostelium album PN500]EFA80326.1 hypothetical protein PPL_07157 [Heterostelium album PN500]|eukprot:XP_020432446.1 hypothetical protein PPL_07157 [Heterostelium album PN500]
MATPSSLNSNETGVCHAYDNKYLLVEYPAGQCNGDVLNAVYYQTYSCFDRTYVTCDPKSKTAEITSYYCSDCNCSESGSIKVSLGCDKDTGAIYSCESTITKMPSSISTFKYVDQHCGGEPYYAQMEATNVCFNSTVVQCTDTSLTMEKYSDADCTGQATPYNDH